MTATDASALCPSCGWTNADGARFCNAAASLGVGLGDVAATGVDVLSFGATKNGALGAEAVVVLRPDLAAAMPFLRKQSMQLASKMRVVSAQMVALGLVFDVVSGGAVGGASSLEPSPFRCPAPITTRTFLYGFVSASSRSRCPRGSAFPIRRSGSSF